MSGLRECSTVFHQKLHPERSPALLPVSPQHTWLSLRRLRAVNTSLIHPGLSHIIWMYCTARYNQKPFQICACAIKEIRVIYGEIAIKSPARVFFFSNHCLLKRSINMKQNKLANCCCFIFCFNMTPVTPSFYPGYEPFNWKHNPTVIALGEDKPVLEMVCLPKKKKRSKMICFASSLSLTQRNNHEIPLCLLIFR